MAQKKAKKKAAKAKKAVKAKKKTTARSAGAKKAKATKRAGKVKKAVKKDLEAASAVNARPSIESELGPNHLEMKVECDGVGCERRTGKGVYCCRAYYIKNWRKIKRKELILKEGKLNRYIEELVAKYPDRYIEAIRNDLANDAEYNQATADLELGDAVDDYDYEGESIDSLIEGIRRDFDEDDF